jgi:hypothetical protein
MFSNLAKKLASFLAVLLLPLGLYAEPQNMNACTKEVYAHTHLSDHSPALYKEANTLYVHSQKDAYQLSMPLMAAGMIGDRGLYKVIEHYMNFEIKKLKEEDPYTDWLRGRILLADVSMNGKITRNDMLIPLQRHVEFSKTTTNFMAWAAGYLGAVDYNYRDKMLEIVEALSADKSVSKSDKLWAWVLVLQAAANAQDKGTYLKTLDKISMIAGKKDVGDALLDGLKRTADSSDYPAWALGIARLASANIGDSTYFNGLEKAMNASMKGAQGAEKLLAEVNNQKAIERNKDLLACRHGKPVQTESCAH